MVNFRYRKEISPIFLLIFVFFLINFGLCQNLTAFGEGMVGDGYQDVINIDISSVVVEAMKQKYRDKPEMKCMHR